MSMAASGVADAGATAHGSNSENAHGTVAGDWLRKVCSVLILMFMVGIVLDFSEIRISLGLDVLRYCFEG